MFSFSWVCGSLLAEDIMGNFGVEGLTTSTYATNAITIAKIIGNLLAAWVLIQLKPRKAFASLLIIAGGLGAFAGNYPLYVFTRLAVGFGGAFIAVYFNPIVLHYFTAPERPAVNAINGVAFNTGTLLALLSVPGLMAWLGAWQHVILFASAASAVCLVFWWVLSDDFPLHTVGSGAAGSESKIYTLRDGIREPFNWIYPLSYSGLLFIYISVFSLFPLIPSFAVPGERLSMLMFGAGMVGALAGIPLAKKVGLRVPLIRYCGLLMTLFAAVMILSASPLVASAAAFLHGFFMFLSFAALYSIPHELPGMTPSRVTVIFAMFWSISYGVETVLMFLAGMLADSTGDPFLAAVFAVICSSSFFLATFFFPETGKRPGKQL